MAEIRSWVQLASAVLSNIYLPGFLKGGIYQGGLKQACVPFLNCYSCPGALGACPVGSIQSLAVTTQRVSLYVAGIVAAFGALGGRFICGWLCPFGWFQELVAKATRFKLQIFRPLLWLKYLVLLLTVLLPLVLVEAETGIAAPYFCKYLCPAGTLEAGLPLLLLNGSLRSLAGSLFLWKVSVLAVFLIAMVVTWRPFCRVACPLGAFYALCNRISLFQMRVDQESCSGCGACKRICPARIEIWEKPDSPECVRCLKCVGSCPERALSWTFGSFGQRSIKC
ncbi:MAG: 4Fe-4S binding protein [Firmicutes bacterium]|nr:4Fe-4S binding protein [Bacillota bacterium]